MGPRECCSICRRWKQTLGLEDLGKRFASLPSWRPVWEAWKVNPVLCSRNVEDECVTARSGVLWGNNVAGRQANAYEFHSGGTLGGGGKQSPMDWWWGKVPSSRVMLFIVDLDLVFGASGGEGSSSW